MKNRRQMTLAVGIGLLVALVVFLIEAPDSYFAFKALHVVFAVIWVGGGVMLTISGLRAERENDPVKLGSIAQQATFAGQFVFTPASLLVLLLGLALMHKGHLSYGDFWVTFGLIVWAVSFATGFFWFRPQTQTLSTMIDERGVQDAEVQERIKSILFVARIDMSLLLLVVVDMTAKPFLG